MPFESFSWQFGFRKQKQKKDNLREIKLNHNWTQLISGSFRFVLDWKHFHCGFHLTQNAESVSMTFPRVLNVLNKFLGKEIMLKSIATRKKHVCGASMPCMALDDIFRHQRRCKCSVNFSFATRTTADGTKANQTQGDVEQSSNHRKIFTW